MRKQVGKALMNAQVLKYCLYIYKKKDNLDQTDTLSKKSDQIQLNRMMRLKEINHDENTHTIFIVQL